MSPGLISEIASMSRSAYVREEGCPLPAQPAPSSPDPRVGRPSYWDRHPAEMLARARALVSGGAGRPKDMQPIACGVPERVSDLSHSRKNTAPGHGQPCGPFRYRQAQRVQSRAHIQAGS